MELDSLPALVYSDIERKRIGLNSFMIEGSPFSLIDGITIPGVITLRIVVVIGNDVRIEAERMKLLLLCSGCCHVIQFCLYRIILLSGFKSS